MSRAGEEYIVEVSALDVEKRERNYLECGEMAVRLQLDPIQNNINSHNTVYTHKVLAILNRNARRYYSNQQQQQQQQMPNSNPHN